MITNTMEEIGILKLQEKKEKKLEGLQKKGCNIGLSDKLSKKLFICNEVYKNEMKRKKIHDHIIE